MTASPSLHVVHVLSAGRFGGLESVVQLLTLGLAGRGHRVEVLLLLDDADDDVPLVDRLEAGGVTVHRLVHGTRAPLAERAAIRHLLGALSPDVVHTHGYRADIQSGAGARLTGRPTVSTLHGFTGGGLKMQFYERLQLACLRRHDRCLAVSESIAQRLRRAGVAPSRIRVLQNAWAPLSHRLSGDAARRELGLPPRDGAGPVIGWVGRLSPEKAPEVALAALTRIKTGAPTLCFVGDGPSRSAVQRAAQAAGVADRVCFAGAQPDAARLFSAFDVLMLSSHTEGTPMVLFEAMQAGVPIVSTRVGGIPEVLDESNAWLVEPGAPDELARALEQVLGDPTAARTRAAAAGRVLTERFSLDAWLDAHEVVYGELAR